MKNIFWTSEGSTPATRCAVFADLLPLLDHPGLEAEEGAAVRDHLASCGACQARQAAYRTLARDTRRYLSPAATVRRFDTEELLAAVQGEDYAASPSGTPASPAQGTVRPYRPSQTRGIVRRLAPVASALVVVLVALVLFSGRIFPGMRGGSGTVSPLFGSQTELDAIAMVSPSEGWAVGWTDPSIDDANGDHALVMHDQGGVWSEVPVPFSGQLSCIAMISATDGWAGGTAGLLHYDGKTWKLMVPSNQWGPSQIQMLSPSDGWAISEAGDLFHYDGQSWTKQALPPGVNVSASTSLRLWGLSMASETDGWVIGNEYSNPRGMATAAIFLHYTQGQWKFGQRIEDKQLFSISMASTTDGWAVGGSLTVVPGIPAQAAQIVVPLLLHYTHGKWMEVKSPLSGPHGTVVMRSAHDGWMADMLNSSGIPLLLHYNGTTWSKVSLPLTMDQNTSGFNITGLALTGAGEVWALADRISNANEGYPLDSHGDYVPTTTPLILQEIAGTWKVIWS